MQCIPAQNDTGGDEIRTWNYTFIFYKNYFFSNVITYLNTVIDVFFFILMELKPICYSICIIQ